MVKFFVFCEVIVCYVLVFDELFFVVLVVFVFEVDFCVVGVWIEGEGIGFCVVLLQIFDVFGYCSVLIWYEVELLMEYGGFFFVGEVCDFVWVSVDDCFVGIFFCMCQDWMFWIFLG